MAKLISGRVKASTLLEVVIAMVIILVVFSLAIGIYNNVLNATTSVKQLQANTITERLIRQTINEKNWTDEVLVQDSIALKKTVLPYEKYPDLLIVTITASRQGKLIAQSTRVIKKTADDD